MQGRESSASSGVDSWCLKYPLRLTLCWLSPSLHPRKTCLPSMCASCTYNMLSHLAVLWLRKSSRAPIMTLTAIDSHAEIWV